jgi:hypothetical protein
VKFSNLSDLYHYFDQLAEQDTDSDILFASSYLRGFIALESSHFGDESQPLSLQLFESVSAEVSQAKTELSPQDYALVNNYWLTLQESFTNH